MTTFFVTAYQNTELDGGRDGLGLLPLWSRLARRCIWNITSISRDLGGWRSLLVCVWIAEQLHDATRNDDDHRPTLLAAERLIALARTNAPTEALRSPEGLRGGTRLKDLAGRVHVIGSERFELLKGQGSTGLIGQIGRPAIRSGLLTEQLRLTDEVQEDVSARLEGLKTHLPDLRRWLIHGEPIDLGTPPSVLDVLAEACSPRPTTWDEVEWLRSWVLNAEHGVDPDGVWTPKRQLILADGIRQHAEVECPLSELVLRLDDGLGQTHDDGGVREWLRDVRALEALLGPMERVFAWLRGATGEARSSSFVQDRLGKAWPDGWELSQADLDRALALVREILPQHEPRSFTDFARGLKDADLGACVEALLQRNEEVTKRRSRRPWFTRQGDLLRAEIPLAATSLGDVRDWSHTYYLKELRLLERYLRPVTPPTAPAEAT